MKRKVGKRLDGTPVELRPHEVIEVHTLPWCDFCRMNEKNVKAEYDFPTTQGSWANGCPKHWVMHSRSPKLGTGYGQMLIARDTVQTEMQATDGSWVAV